MQDFDSLLTRLEIERLQGYKSYRSFEITEDEETGELIADDGRDTIVEKNMDDLKSEIDQHLAIRKDIARQIKEEVWARSAAEEPQKCVARRLV